MALHCWSCPRVRRHLRLTIPFSIGQVHGGRSPYSPTPHLEESRSMVFTNGWCIARPMPKMSGRRRSRGILLQRSVSLRVAEYREHPDDFYSLRVGYGGTMGALTDHRSGRIRFRGLPWIPGYAEARSVVWRLRPELLWPCLEYCDLYRGSSAVRMAGVWRQH